MKKQCLSALRANLVSTFVVCMAISTLGCRQANSQSVKEELPPLHIKIEKVADGFHAPIYAAFPAPGEMLVTEQAGVIRFVKNGKTNPKPFLDIRSKVVSLDNSYDERGLLGLALSPDYKVNKKFYVFYSAPSSAGENNKGVLEEFKASPANNEVADPNSGRVLLTVEHPEMNHDGGCLQFGPDGYLYFSIGDGGGAGDRHGDTGNGQNLNVLLGKLMRIDVNSGKTYTVPKDNPFVGKAGARPEIWAYGLRNTWRFSFDKATGKLMAGDVGQDTYEEVDIIEKGKNYGWRITEATHCFNPSSGCDFKGITLPIAEYSHHEGISITGGYIYNGKAMPAFTGKYLFADWSGPMFYLQKTGAGWKRGKLIIDGAHPSDLKNISFGEDASGELYIVTSPDTGPGSVNGAIYKIVN